MTTGWTDDARKGITVPVPRNVWTTIHVAEGLAIGPTILNAQLYGTLSRIPAASDTIILRWARMGQPDGDARYTQRQPCPMGERTSWSATMLSSLEFVGADDVPLALQVFTDIPDVGAKPGLTLTTIVVKAHNPAAYIAARVSPDPED